MGSNQPRQQVSIVETGLEPEYLITDIVRAEPVGGGMMRLYLATKKQNTLAVQFTVVGALGDFFRMAKQVQDMAADRHNLEMWQLFIQEDGESH